MVPSWTLSLPSSCHFVWYFHPLVILKSKLLEAVKVITNCFKALLQNMSAFLCCKMRRPIYIKMSHIILHRQTKLLKSPTDTTKGSSYSTKSIKTVSCFITNANNWDFKKVSMKFGLTICSFKWYIFEVAVTSKMKFQIMGLFAKLRFYFYLKTSNEYQNKVNTSLNSIEEMFFWTKLKQNFEEKKVNLPNV